MKAITPSPVRHALNLGVICAIGLFMAVSLPLSAAAKGKLTDQKEDSLAGSSTSSGYVASVFDKLQGQWQAQAVDNPVTSNNVLTFTLNEDGTLVSSHVDGAQLGSEANARAVMDLLSKHAPFGPFPSSLKDSRLTFKVKLTPDSLHMVSYQIVEKNKPEPMIAYAASAVAQPVSMFYTRALPSTPGRVWEKPDAHASDEQTMADYVDLVQRQVRAHWQLPQDYNFNRTVALLMIDRDGTLLGAQLTQGSGDKTVDQAALKAITDAGKFPQAPANVPSLPVTIEYVFEPVHQTE
jgi:TonB family protein